MSRSFTITHVKKTNGSKINYIDGRFIGDSPDQAVRKMFSKIYHYLNKTGPFSLDITLYETTQNSLHKTYKYRVKKINQKNIVEINGNDITFNFTVKVKSI